MVDKGIILLGIGLVVVVSLAVMKSQGSNEEPCLTESCTVPEQIAICIDGTNFGVCTGEPIFDSGQACFGLTTQECFDKCNAIGMTCRAV